MDEQSHKEEMRAALRGDFERLQARRGTPAVPLAQEHPLQAVSAAEPPGAGDPSAGEAPHRGWMTRLLGRC
jgi:hypothetical protein